MRVFDRRGRWGSRGLRLGGLGGRDGRGRTVRLDARKRAHQILGRPRTVSGKMS